VDEKKQIAVLVAVAFGIGIAACIVAVAIPGLFEGDLVIADYRAELGGDGTFSEQYTYEVKTGGKYRMLYRYWMDPLSIEALGQPHIRFQDMEVPQGTVGYVKEYDGTVTLVGSENPEYVSFVRQMAENSEIGIYNPAYFLAGRYEVTYRYVLVPPLEYDDRNAHLNLRLVDRNIPYRNLAISVPARYVETIYPHPPTLQSTLSGDRYIITGRIASDEGLGVEMLLTRDALGDIPGFPVSVEQVREETEAANPWYAILPATSSGILRIFGFAAAVLTPLVLLGIYLRSGREKEFVVPEYLSTTPDPRMKPWAVNLLFKGDAKVFDQDGYYATLLDLHRKKLITITEEAGGANLRIRLNAVTAEDPYEQRVLTFLSEIAQDNMVNSADLEILATRAKTDRSDERRILSYQRDLALVTRKTDPALAAKYIVDGREHLFPVLFAGIALCAISLILIITIPVLSAILVPAVILFGSVIVQAGVALSFPSTLFGHWKEDRYREKLEWDAFARFLSDLALIRQYSPADISLWGEWLIFGTAMGVGDKVEKAMKELDIRMPETIMAPVSSTGLHAAFLPVLFFSPPSRGGSGGGFGGGSFGGGGGFGGGGVGGR
jgi:uncharacterized membrane protein